ncbi:MAG: hypothetical protein PHP23_08605 [Desulfobacterales bacterium]|nr:hypothetical protein [Desulfobacterales bacterium]MDD4071245.1 hypothetical protein [Desulfobacterales bacterium]MDD4393269.1 hypothetical protein [Desulfobacterales bacterium]
MLDLSVSYNRYKFLGCEFLTWLWFVIEKEQERFLNKDGKSASLAIGNRIVLEKRIDDDTHESVTIKGDDAGLEEGVLALKKGAVVTQINLVYTEGDFQWKFALTGESLNVTGLKPPETAIVEIKDDIEGAVLEKVFLYGKVVELIDRLYQQFIQLRVSDQWDNQLVPQLKQWINS